MPHTLTPKLADVVEKIKNLPRTDENDWFQNDQKPGRGARTTHGR
jgi:hypothetical protein